MHPRWQRQVRKVGQVRGALHEAVRGPVLGREYGCVEGVGAIEGINARVAYER